jgi:hypothetical protein
MDIPKHIAEYRTEFPQQPATDRSDLSDAIVALETALPGWWWSVCVCSRSRDASCGPDMAGPDADLLTNRLFDDGFHCDCDGTLADALRDVMEQAVDARKNYRSELAQADQGPNSGGGDG